MGCERLEVDGPGVELPPMNHSRKLELDGLGPFREPPARLRGFAEPPDAPVVSQSRYVASISKLAPSWRGPLKA